MKYTLLAAFLFLSSAVAMAKAPAIDPAADYEELTDTKPHDSPEVWAKMAAPAMLGWGSTDVRYKKLDIPQTDKSKRLDLTAWRGETVQAQAVIWTRRDLKDVKVSVSDLTNGKSVIPASDLTTNFVRYVMTDQLNPDGGGCGFRENKAEWDSLLVADVLDIAESLDIAACSTRPVWVEVKVPYDCTPGKYTGTLTVTAEGLKPMSLKLQVKVIDRTLPDPRQWALHLDLWQNPYAVARYYDVPLWSPQHLDLCYPIMKMLADIGQRNITASIMCRPWDGQTVDQYDSMITRIKKIDGSWEYDYTVFDLWVDFMTNRVGIDGTINCYTMIPWSLKFDYFDQATNLVQYVEAYPDEEAYKDYWMPFLKDFARHLKEKGWFGRTAIAMDERAMEDMRNAISLIKEADPEYKISLAGNYHPEIEPDLCYLSIPYGKTFPDDVKARREKNGQISTVYTCCTESFPNLFTFSDPAEAAWTVIHAVAGGYDGYLRWASNSWTTDPLRDSRHSRFAAGDCYNIYPGPRSSIRFERLKQGLQMCEKINVLRKEYTAKGDTKKLEQLDKALRPFTYEAHEENPQPAAIPVHRLDALLNSL